MSSKLPNATYGFIGLGVMGSRMARNLRLKIPSTSALVVSEIVETRLNEFLETVEGKVEVVKTPREIAEKCEIIITMLPAGPHVKDCFTNPSTGLLSYNRPSSNNDTPRKLFIEMSTIDQPNSKLVAEAIASSPHPGIYIDAPVSGGPNGAEAATLTIMVGSSSSEDFNLVLPILQTMGSPKSIFHCGGPGAGLATKAINNYLSFICTLGTCEAMNMGRLYGLDPKVLAGVMNVSSGQNYNSRDQNPVKGVTATAASAKDFEGGFSMELCKGVVDMAIQLGEEVGAKSVMKGVVKDVLGKAIESDKCRGKDCRSVYKLFSEDEGKDLDGVGERKF